MVALKKILSEKIKMPISKDIRETKIIFGLSEKKNFLLNKRNFYYIRYREHHILKNQILKKKNFLLNKIYII